MGKMKEKIAYKIDFSEGLKPAFWEKGDPTIFFMIPSEHDYGYDFDVIVTQETSTWIEKKYQYDVCNNMSSLDFLSGFADEVISIPLGFDLQYVEKYQAKLSIVPLNSLSR